MSVQLSQRLNIRISELFANPIGSVETAVTSRRRIGYTDDAVRVNTKNYDYYLLGVCSSTDESLMESLLSMHGDAVAAKSSRPADQAPSAHLRKTRKRKMARG